MKLMIHELRGGDRAPARRPSSAVPEDLRALQAGAAPADREVVGAGDADAVGVHGVPRHAGAVVGLPVAAVPHDRVPAGQQERGDAARCSRTTPQARPSCAQVLESPSLYDEFLRYLARHGHAVPARTCERDWSQPHVSDPALLPVFERIYEDTDAHWARVPPVRGPGRPGNASSSCGASATCAR